MPPISLAAARLPSSGILDTKKPRATSYNSWFFIAVIKNGTRQESSTSLTHSRAIWGAFH
ncbi:hypothetical protein AB832_01925 [Flavobacteriaceae bacterium (ex Bugula neritina AB1)]|nr:hypothetical protein AB832_01925 [Flavobacteriaceae bacterium (ex Bugula neritina AB1)]